MLKEDPEAGLSIPASPATAGATKSSEYDSLVRGGPSQAERATAHNFNRILRVALVVVSVLLVALGLALLVAVSRKDNKPKVPLILISLDGFRWDYMTREKTPNLQTLANKGVKAQWMQPQFPSKTFPNHYTIVTGLYPESHGIVDNTMWDPVMNQSFSLSNVAANRNAAWWWGEPIWVTAVKQGLKSACYFWPGSEAAIDGVRPTYYVPFNSSVPYTERVAQIVEWVKLPADKRPAILTLYLDITDTVGHAYGPDSSQEDDAIALADATVGELISKLENITDFEYNVLIVSDHGMTNTNLSRVIFLDDYIDTSLFTIVDLSPNVYIIPGPNITAEQIYATLSGAHPNLTMYYKNEIPKEYHYENNRRITPLFGISDLGWEVRLRSTFNPNFFFLGDHGYDNRQQDMQATFIAQGPAFQSGLEVDPIQNLEVYGIICHVLGLHAAPNNGSLANVEAIFSNSTSITQM